MSEQTPFYIKILDADGEYLNEGPIVTLQTLNDTKRLDAVGGLEFTLPITEPRAQFLTAGCQIDVYDQLDGHLGRYYYSKKTQRFNEDGSTELLVQAVDQLTELTRKSVRFRRTYTAQEVGLVVGDLVEDVEGWEADGDANMGLTSVTYEGNSVLNAVDTLRDRWNKHFRLIGERHLEFGVFGYPSGVTLTNLPGQVQANLQANREIALVESLRMVEEVDDVVNYVIPLGAGQGVSQLTIELASGGDYSVNTGTNEDGSNFYYIRDSASITAYGERQRALSLPTLRPITNSDADIANAATALKSAAEAYMTRHLEPLVVYNAPVRFLRRPLNVGDTVKLRYRGVVENYSFVDIDQTFYVMDITRKRHTNGRRGAELTLSSVAQRRTTDVDVLLQVIADVKALKVDIPITVTYSPIGPYVKRISDTVSAEFTIRLAEEITFLNRALMRFKTSPLKSSVQSISAGAADTSSSERHTHNVVDSGAHSHSVEISGGGAHSHDVVISSTGLGSSGASSEESTPSSVPHYHNLGLNTSGPTGFDLYWSDGAGLNTAPGPSSFPTTETDEDSMGGHTHGIDHTHNVDHDHGATTTSSEVTDITGAATESETHDHDIESSGEHSHDIPSHNHVLAYGVFEDTVYPQGLHVQIDGVDVTNELGGPWATTNGAVDVEVNITDYLLNAAGGLKQNHEVEFSCATPSTGELEFEVDLMVSIQPILIS